MTNNQVEQVIKGVAIFALGITLMFLEKSGIEANQKAQAAQSACICKQSK